MEKKLRIEYLPSAQKDMREILDYISLDNPDAAYSLLNEFDETISLLSFFPFKGSVPNDTRLHSLGYRMLIVGNYIIFYVINDNLVEIRRVIYGKQKYDFLLWF